MSERRREGELTFSRGNFYCCDITSKKLNKIFFKSLKVYAFSSSLFFSSLRLSFSIIFTLPDTYVIIWFTHRLTFMSKHKNEHEIISKTCQNDFFSQIKSDVLA